MYDYAVTLTHVPDYGRVKVLFGSDEGYKKEDNDGTLVVSIEDVQTLRQFKSLKEYVIKKGYL